MRSAALAWRMPDPEEPGSFLSVEEAPARLRARWVEQVNSKQVTVVDPDYAAAVPHWIRPR